MQSITLLSLLFVTSAVTSSNIFDQYNDEERISSSHSCNFCIYEDRVVGSPSLVINISDSTGWWTCDSMQRAAKNGDFDNDEEVCHEIQRYAEYCNCGRGFNSTQSEQSESNIFGQSGEEGNTQSDTLATLATILTSVFLFFLVFGLSATVPVNQLKQQLTNKRALITGGVMQFLVMPLMGFISVMFFKNTSNNFTKAMGLTLMVVTASPGGSYSNWWCSLFNADLALSMAMTAVSTILSLGMLPANLILYSHLAYGMHDDGADDVVGALDFGTLFTSLGIVMVALLAGLYTSYKLESKAFMTWANRGASLSGGCLIITSVYLSSGNDTTFWNQEWNFYVGVAFPCLVGLILSNIFSLTCARLKKPECVAIAIECCYQNTGIAMSVAVTMFKDPEQQAQALAVPIFYGFVQVLVVACYCVISWKLGWTKAPADESLCIVLSTPYEIVESDDNNSSSKSLAANNSSVKSLDINSSTKSLKDSAEDDDNNDNIQDKLEKGKCDEHSNAIPNRVPSRWEFWKYLASQRSDKRLLF